MSNTPWRRVTVELEVDSGVTHTESATVPNTPGSGKGTYWVRSDGPTVPMYTDSAGTDFVLNESGGALTGSPGNVYENLQFYVDPSDRNSFPATGGTVATDLEGNGTAGTLSAAAIFDNGAWTFTGSAGETVSFTKGATLDNIFTGGGTVIALIRPYSDGASSGRVIDTDNGLGTAGYLIYMAEESGGRLNIAFGRNWSTQDGLWVTDNVTDAFGNSGPLLQAGDWGVLALSYNDAAIGNDPTFYWNGTPVAFTEDLDPQGSAQTDAGEDIFIGNRSDGLRAFDGQIGTFLMFDRVLSAQEVQQVSDVFAARRGIGIRGYDSPGTAFPISGQTIEIRAGDSDSTNASADPGNILLQAGHQTNASGGPAGEIIIRSGDQTTGTSFGTGSRVLIESGRSSTEGGVTVRVGLQTTTNTPGVLTLSGADSDGGPGGAVLMRGGGPTSGIAGAITVRGGDGADNSGTNNDGGAATFRGGDGIGFGGNGGALTLRAGDGVSDLGGDVIIRSGTSVGFDAGDVTITASDAGSSGVGGKITVRAGLTTTTGTGGGGGITFTTGGSPGNFTDFHAGDFEITTGNATGSATQPNSGAGSFYFTGGTSNATVTTSPGGEFEVTAGAGVANSVNSRGGAVSLTGGDVTGTAAATAGGVTLTGGAATVGTGGTISLQPGAGTVADGGLILDYSLYPPADGTAGFVLSTDGAGVLSWIAGGGGTPTWSAVLTAGATSGATIPILSSGQTFQGEDTTGANGGDLLLRGGAVTGVGIGGDASLIAGTGGTTSGAGGQALVQGGVPGVSGEAAGTVSIQGGNGSGSAGGAAFLTGGNGSSAVGGAASVQGGTAGPTFAGGEATLQGGTGNTTGPGGTATVQGGTAGTSGIGGSVQVLAANGGGTAGNGGTTQIESGDGVASGTFGGSINLITGASVDATGATSQFIAGTTNAGIGGGLILQASDGTTGGGVMTIRSGSATVSGNPGNILLEPGTGVDDEGYVDIDPDWTGDASHFLQFSASGTNTSNATQLFTGNRNPNTLITGQPGSLYLRGSGINSSLFVNTGAAVGTTWTAVGASAPTNGVSTLVQTDQTLTTGSLTASGGTVDLDITSFIDEGQIFDLQVTRTAGTGGDDIDVEIFTEDAFTNRIYFAEAADASTAFRDTSGIFYEDLDTTQELHIRITNQSAAATTFDVRARGQGEGLLALNALSFTATKTVAYTGSSWEYIKWDPVTVGTFQIDFPPSPSIGDRIGTKNVTTSATTITVSGNGNNLEDPGTPGSTAGSVTVGGAGDYQVWQYDGTDWWIV